MAAIAIVRIRGHAKIQHRAVKTMDMMKLTRPNHCVLLPENSTTKGMLQVVKDFVTWGEVGHETIARMLFQRGEVIGGGKLTDAYVKENSKYPSILSLAKAMEKGEAKVSDVKGLKPVIRLPPPRKGYRSTRRSYSDGGSLGYRGADIEKLVDRMLAKPMEDK
ncbi:MAG: 50S ribosomal protein L30 [Thermoplasmatota archaeon]|nr:50S ribosomal protein L30 [Candidatus Thermoplasmatota archaeon]